MKCIGCRRESRWCGFALGGGIKAVLAEIGRSQPRAAILQLGISRGPKPDGTREKLAVINQELSQLNGKGQVTCLDVTAKLLPPGPWAMTCTRRGRFKKLLGSKRRRRDAASASAK